jgi:ABC-type branched-subunit amino acid transport system substrate-binding protein
MKIIIQFILLIFLVLFFNVEKSLSQEKIKIGLIVPLSGEYKEIGESIINSTRLAINKINNSQIEILPRDTKSNPEITLRVAKKLHELGVRIIIGPVFNKNLIYLEELNNVIFLSLTNKITNNPKNVISAGINAISQINAIIKFQELYKIKRSIFLIPNSDFKNEIEEAISKTKIKLKDTFIYDTDPTLLTAQIEKLTRYSQRKQRLKDEIERLENSNEVNKEKKISDLEKKDTFGGINFDSVIIADFDESLKSVTTSLLYTDVSSKRIHYICLNQWFDKSLLKEKSLQPIYFPSINKENYDEFVSKYFNIYQKYPNQISFLSYDLVGLVYYLIYQNNFVVDEKIFYKKNKFKGKIGVFEINKNKIGHLLNFYVAEEEKFKKIF